MQERGLKYKSFLYKNFAFKSLLMQERGLKSLNFHLFLF